MKDAPNLLPIPCGVEIMRLGRRPLFDSQNVSFKETPSCCHAACLLKACVAKSNVGEMPDRLSPANFWTSVDSKGDIIKKNCGGANG